MDLNVSILQTRQQGRTAACLVRKVAGASTAHSTAAAATEASAAALPDNVDARPAGRERTVMMVSLFFSFLYVF